MSEHRRLIEKITDPDYLQGLAERSLEQLRANREECREVENELSFERRLCQARIDILSAELDRRAGRGEGDLMERLPRVLATEGGGTQSPLPPRAPDFSIPRSADVPRRRVDEIVGEQTLARIGDMEPDEITSILTSLAEHEKSLSGRRRQVQDLMDRVQAEIVRRYTSGEADPAAALR